MTNNSILGLLCKSPKMIKLMYFQGKFWRIMFYTTELPRRLSTSEFSFLIYLFLIYLFCACVISGEQKWSYLTSGCSGSIQPSSIPPGGQPTRYFAFLGWRGHQKKRNCIIQRFYWPCIARPSYKGCSTRIRRSPEILSLVDWKRKLKGYTKIGCATPDTKNH